MLDPTIPPNCVAVTPKAMAAARLACPAVLRPIHVARAGARQYMPPAAKQHPMSAISAMIMYEDSQVKGTRFLFDDVVKHMTRPLTISNTLS